MSHAEPLPHNQLGLAVANEQIRMENEQRRNVGDGH
jgi:hypothetical protein